MFTGTCLALQPCPAASPLDGALQKHLEASRQEARCPAPTRSGHPKNLGSARGVRAGAGQLPWGPGSCSAPGLPAGAWVPPTCSHPCSVPRACRKSRWMDQICFFQGQVLDTGIPLVLSVCPPAHWSLPGTKDCANVLMASG